MEQPTQNEWDDLYQAAIRFKEMAPWQWMADMDLFGVENPDGGEVGWCSILGNERQEFGLLVFLGAEGFQMYNRIAMGEAEATSLELWARVPLLSMTFNSRDDLERRDLEMIRALGLRFRGRAAWPLFRSQRPGYVPWYLDKAEVTYLSAVVQQTLSVAGRVREERLDLFEEADNGMLFTRYCRTCQWLDGWRKPKIPSRAANTPVPLDEARLSGLRKAAKELRGKWELDIFLLPTAVQEGSDRPYYPTCVMAVETQTGLIVGADVAGVVPSPEVLQDAVIRVLGQGKQLPHDLRVMSEEVLQVVEPVAQALGMSVRVARMAKLERARRDLVEHFLGHGC